MHEFCWHDAVATRVLAVVLTARMVGEGSVGSAGRHGRRPTGSAPLPPRVARSLRRAGPSGRHQRRLHGRRLLVVAAVAVLVGVVVLGVAGYGYARWRFSQIASVDLPGLHKPPSPGRPMVVLVVGSDARAELHQPGDAARFGTTQDAGGIRGDVIMLVRVDPKHRTVKVLSIPRDLLVPIAGTGRRAKINAALAAGPEQLIQTIQTQLHLPINHYLLVNFDGFRAIVDSLGGIRLDFPYPAGDPYAGLHISRPGCQQLDGDQALAVARARHYRYLKDGRWQADPLSDLGRIGRQQVFLRAVLQAALARGLANPVRANRFLGAVVGELTRDRGLTAAEAVGLAGQFRRFDPAQLAGQTLPTTADHYQGYGDVLLPKQPDTDQVIASFLGRPQPATGGSSPARPRTHGQVTVRVQNATATSGLAARISSRLRRLGWQATTAGNASPASRSQLRYPPGQQPTARALAGSLLGPIQLTQDPTLPDTSLLLILGRGYQGIRGTPAPTTTTTPAGSTPAPPTTPPAPPRDFDPQPC
jgi:LCP family protein required for cell wall assembly